MTAPLSESRLDELAKDRTVGEQMVTWFDLFAEVRTSRKTLARIRGLHWETTSTFREFGGEPKNVCACCQFYWPCPTIRALDGAS